MGKVNLIIKLMPESPEADLKEIESAVKSTLESEEAKNIIFEQKPIAFGLNALIVKFDVPEEKGTEMIESKLSSIKSVSSVTIEDYRRAFG